MSFTVCYSKERGNKLNEALYENVRLLTLIHPPRKEFLEVFRKDMFAKNNKAAFFEVVYYLLNLLDPELTSEKLPSWPPYDIKMENKFRMELLKYINELNAIYDNSNIPHIMASQLISPGGVKFVIFMLKLSQLVLFEELTNSDLVLLYTKTCKDENTTKTIINNMQSKVKDINNATNKLTRDFQEHFDKCRTEANDIVNQQKMLNKQIADAKIKYEKVKQDLEVKSLPCLSIEELINKYETLQKNAYEISIMHSKFIETSKIQEKYLSSDRILTHNKKKLKVPTDIVHIVNNGDQLDLQQYFQGLLVLLQKKSFNLQIPSLALVKKLKDHIEIEIKQLKDINEDLSKKIEKNKVLSEKIQHQSDSIPDFDLSI